MTDCDATAIRWHPADRAGCLVLAPSGQLHARTYRTVRDGLVKFALDQPRALIVVLDDLRITSWESLSAFSSAWLRINDWPGVPILLVADNPRDRAALAGSALARHVSVHADIAAALAGIGDPSGRRRTETELIPIAASSRLARRFVERTCADWGIADRTMPAMQVATELVENAIIHAGTDMRLRLELHDGRLAIAVRDGSSREAVRRESGDRPANGLRLVAQLATAWGCAPDNAGGKVVWAVLAG